METILSVIFTVFNACFIFNEILWLLSPYAKAEKSINDYLYFKEHKEWKDWDSDMKSRAFIKILCALYYIWFIAGLLTFQWQFFAIFLLWLIVISPFFRIARKMGVLPYAVMSFINTIVCLAFGLFVLLNKYHFRISNVFF